MSNIKIYNVVRMMSLAVALLLLLCMVTLAQPLVEIHGKKYWFNGINIPWNAFGTDFGTHYEWGALHDSTLFEATFKKYSESGVNCVRIWIHCDGRSTPEFDAPGGNITGLDANFLTDFDNMMAIAQKYKVFVMPTLWSFDMVKVNTDAGQYAGICVSMITDTTKTNQYIDKVLIPLVKRFDNHPYLFCWEICNEPEWIIETEHACPVQDLQRFHAMLTKAIHENCSTPVTTGAASLKWNSNHPDCSGGGGGHWWSDSSMATTYPGGNTAMDLYQVHFYEWMIPWYVPYTKGVDYWGDIGDRPVIIGETPGHDVTNAQFTMTLTEMYEEAYKKGYAGVFAWSDKANDGHGTWDNIKVATQAFAQNHPDIVSGIPVAIQKDNLPGIKNANDLHIINNSKTIIIKFTNTTPGNVSIDLFKINGSLIKKVYDCYLYAGEHHIDFNYSNMPNGTFLISLHTSKSSVMKKMVILK